MTHQIIPLTLSQSLTETGIVKAFAVSKSKVVTNLLIDLNGNYNNKKVVSTVNLKNWHKTQQALKDALTEKSVVGEHIGLILDDLDNNSATVLQPFNGNGSSNNNNGDSDDSANTDSQSSEITRSQVVKALEEAMNQNQGLTFEEWHSGLIQRYESIKQAMDKDFPNGWPGVEFTLSVMKILNIDDCDLPFAGIMLARSGGLKTLGLDMLVPWTIVYHTRKFNPRAFVTHNASVESEDKLAQIDLLPRIRFKLLVTPELSTIFSANEDELLENIGIITSILDGRGYTSDSGAHGQRGYHGNYHFVWVGASVDIPHRVHKLLSSLGPKIYVMRLPYDEPHDQDIKDCLNERFKAKRLVVQKKLMEYLIWSELCPLLEIDPETKLSKIQWDSQKDDIVAINQIVRLARLLGRLRCHVEIWSPNRQSQGHEYSEYGHSLPTIEDPRRAATCLYNLTRGYAWSRGRNYITLDDLHLAIKVALTTGSKERIAVFDYLIAKKGTANLSDVASALTMSKSTALKYMTELTAVGLAELNEVQVYGNITQQITLVDGFFWLYSSEFLELKGNYSPVDRSKYNGSGKRTAKQSELFWAMFSDLENEAPQTKYVELNRLVSFISNRCFGVFDGTHQVEEFVSRMIEDGLIVPVPDKNGIYSRVGRGV